MKLKIFLGLWISFSCWASPIIEIDSLNEFENYLNNSQYNGVGIVVKNNVVLWKKAFGKKAQDRDEKLSVNDKFQIGSNTKQFIAASLLKLESEGKLSLQDEITKYFPNIKSFAGITIIDILNHTSGIVNYTDQVAFWKFAEQKNDLTLVDIIDFSTQYPLDFAPKSNWNYSNTGYIIAGKIVELVSGFSWDDYLKENFLVPMKMNDSGYVTRFNDISDVAGHLEINGEIIVNRDFNLTWALSAGALYSTLDDMVKWTEIFLDSPILSNEAKSKMQTPYLNNYALGIKVSKFRNDILIGHSGRTPGFVSNSLLLKNQKLKIVTLDNEDGKLGNIDRSLLDIFTIGKATVLKNAVYDIPQNILHEYIGVFDSQGFQFTITEENGKLILKTNDNQPPYTLKPVDEDSFNLLNIAGEEFNRDGSGKVIGLTHYQNGQKTYFTKLDKTQPLNVKYKFKKLLKNKFNFQRDVF